MQTRTSVTVWRLHGRQILAPPEAAVMSNPAHLLACRPLRLRLGVCHNYCGGKAVPIAYTLVVDDTKGSSISAPGGGRRALPTSRTLSASSATVRRHFDMTRVSNRPLDQA